MRGRRATTRLFLANPGYLPDSQLSESSNGVVALGSLPHDQVIQHVRQAFCVFYPQATFEETFGLVFAEANAVGTPVLAHPIGSAPEVLSNPNQLVDARHPEHVADVMMRWYAEGRPHVRGKDEYRLSRVISRWERLLGLR